MRKTVADFLLKHNMVGAKLAVGVSGGRDSMCLLHALMNCGVVPRENITAVHVNHGLRKEAAADQEFVQEFCAANGIDFSAYKVDVHKYVEQSGQTVEQAARNLRYNVFYSLLSSGYSAVLTAHHALDNAESVLMHIFRGAGLDGLSGMNAANAQDSKILRPLLSVYPDELDEYAENNGIKYVVDKTNLQDDADRNFLRLNVIPLIEQRYRGAVRAVNALSEECGAVCDILDGSLDLSLVKYDGGAAKVTTAALDSPISHRYIRQAIKYFSLTDVTRAQIERVAQLKDMRVGASVELANGIMSVREYDGVALYIPRYKYDGSVTLKKGANFLDGLRVDVEPVSVDKKELKTRRGEIADFGKLNGAELRFRRDGDIFVPFGGKEKKLKEYFITEKIPSRLRDRIPLVCRDGEVLVIVGHEISDRVKVTDVTADAVTVKRFI